MTLSKVAQKLNITHPALYKHFKNKDELWTAVLINWFNSEVFQKIDLTTDSDPKLVLKNWLWQFINLKRQIANTDAKMFALNTKYIDERPLVLRDMLQDSYAKINTIMDYDPQNNLKAEAIMSAFAVFTAPSFKETWNSPDYEERFNAIWMLIEPSL
ncbi:TetR/AcrR family transcriptional regulator [Levilactobacillus tongjiangensis]|uniref:TetR/AcrR family transcriptional regulator n=1 Tax=Levilactobacillus tongjiangensis TaxID=2486023 RepID=A0ABW1SPW7_9LACO|nr:TetR/AcrR family transcriptional regulator [Levilactobacillus tongjiangensis]